MAHIQVYGDIFVWPYFCYALRGIVMDGEYNGINGYFWDEW